MKDALVTAALVLSITCACPAQGQQPSGNNVVAPLEWEPGTIGGSAPRRVTLRDEPPAGVTLPAGIAKAHFGTLTFANGKLAIALDANPGNPRLWVDRDFDGDLAEETNTRMSRQARTFTRTQIVLAPYDGETDPSPIELHWTCQFTAATPRLSVRLAQHRRGTVVLGGRLRLVAAVDGDGDGRFDDPERDRIYVDRDGDGDLQAGRGGDDRVVPGQPFRVGDEGWTVRVAVPSGRLVEFVRSSSVPPARPRVWPSVSRPTAGVKRTPPKESLASLLQRLESERTLPYVQRVAAINLIGNVGTAAAFDALAELAHNEKDRSVRAAALRALGNPAFLTDRGDRLAALARDANATDAYGVAQALYYAGHPDREGIYADMLESLQPQFVNAAARWLAYSGSEQAEQAILTAVVEAATPSVRYGAYTQGARNLPGGPPLATVLHAARDDYAMLRAQAIQDLDILGHPDAVRLALQAANERPVHVTIGTAMCEVLGPAGTPAAVAAILGMLEDEKVHGNVRKAAVEQLRFIRARKSVAVMVKALSSKQPKVRAVAAEILAALTERNVTAALLKRAKKEKDEEVLALLLEALGDHGDPIAMSVLLKRARSKQPAIRTAAVRGLARLGFHHDKVRRFFLSMLDSRDWVDRVLALDAAKVAKNKTLLPKVKKSLGHRAWQVRLAAVESLAALRVREAVLPLIERLDLEQKRRVRDSLATALFSLTGVNAYDNVKMWRMWWSDNGKTFQVPDEIPVLPNRSAGGTGASFYGIPVTSERVVFLIDQSGSMSAIGQAAEGYREKQLNRLEIAVRETLGALTRMGDKAKVNVIMFHSTIHPWQDQLQKLRPNRKELKRTLESKRPTGGTNIYDGLELALRMKEVDTIFLLSDGQPGQGKFVAIDDILRGVRRENQTRRIAIHCVAIGTQSQLLRRLAAESGGRYVRR